MRGRRRQTKVAVKRTKTDDQRKGKSVKNA
jgi:hypothetical protein